MGWLAQRIEPEPEGHEQRCRDRRCHRTFRLHERRSGFDRRYPTGGGFRLRVERGLLHFRAHPDHLLLVLVLMNGLNVLDALFTANALRMGAWEANPLLRWIMENGTVPALGLKLAAVAVLSVFLWRLRRFRMAVLAPLVVGAAYTLVNLYHVLFLATAV